jgi:hypothetical protein
LQGRGCRKSAKLTERGAKVSVKRVQKLANDAGAALFIARTLRQASPTIPQYEPFVARAAAVYEKRGHRYAERARNISAFQNIAVESDTEQGGV